MAWGFERSGGWYGWLVYSRMKLKGNRKMLKKGIVQNTRRSELLYGKEEEYRKCVERRMEAKGEKNFGTTEVEEMDEPNST